MVIAESVTIVGLLYDMKALHILWPILFQFGSGRLKFMIPHAKLSNSYDIR